MIKVIELFAGIGACSKALERLGIEHQIVDAVEMTIPEWIEFITILIKVAIVVVPIGIVIIIAEMVRFIIWTVRKIKEKRYEKDQR